MSPLSAILLLPLFAAAFRHVQPYASLSDEERLAAARECLEQTRSALDGPVIEPACFIARGDSPQRIIGAIMITLIPREREGDWWTARWDEVPVTEDARRLLGRPHLTWVFVVPTWPGRGLGSALLAQSVSALRSLGYVDLATTFLLGNDASVLWHWRNGFRLLPYPGASHRSVFM